MSNSGQKSGKALERVSFVNLLSQFLKEKRNLGDISVGMASKPESKGLETSSQQAITMNFLLNMDNSSESSKQNLVASTSNAKPSGFFPEIGSFGTSSSEEDTNNMTDFRKPAKVEAKNSQLTIFFAGQVVVFNDFPADKFKEIVDLIASHGCSTACSGVVADTGKEKVNSKIEKIESSNPEIPDLNVFTTTGNSPPPRDPSVERCQYGGSDLRIARRNSLHKFFEKRKDRAATRAPYQVNLRESPPPSKADENKSSHEEGQSSKEASRDLDLNL